MTYESTQMPELIGTLGNEVAIQSSASAFLRTSSHTTSFDVIVPGSDASECFLLLRESYPSYSRFDLPLE